MAFRTEESLDTNILLRLALRDVPKQCRQIQDLLMRQGVRFNVADLAVTEAVYAELNEAEPLWTFDQKLASQVGTARLVGA